MSKYTIGHKRRRVSRNPRYTRGSFIADMQATGRQDCRNTYEHGDENQPVARLVDEMMYRLKADDDYPDFDDETLRAGAQAWAEAFLAEARAKAEYYRKKWEEEEAMYDDDYDAERNPRLRNPSSGAKQRARGTRQYKQSLLLQGEGAKHARALAGAADARKFVREFIVDHAGRARPYDIKQDVWSHEHRDRLARAARHRPALPNPSRERGTMFLVKKGGTFTHVATTRHEAEAQARKSGGKVFIAESAAESDREHKALGKVLARNPSSASGRHYGFSVDSSKNRFYGWYAARPGNWSNGLGCGCEKKRDGWHVYHPDFSKDFPSPLWNVEESAAHKSLADAKAAADAKCALWLQSVAQRHAVARNPHCR
jgi:hypothetical protein